MRRRDDKGSTLLMALVMVGAIGLMIGAGLSYGGTSMRTSNNVTRPNRAALYAADSATQAAIEYLRDNPTLGADLGIGCTNNLFTYPDPIAGSVTVDACPQADSFIYDGNFRAVLLTLAGPTSGEGITFAKNNDFTVSGHVWSNSFITLGSSADMTVNDGRLWSWNVSSCSNGITAPAGKDCSAKNTFNNVVPKVGLDPGDPSLGHSTDWQPAAAPGAAQALPACVSGSATLQPGVYSSGSALSALSAGCDLTLSPGVYHLNFPANDHTWTIANDVTAACDGTGQGAQIVFANAARLDMADSNQELTICGRRATADGPLIAMTALQTSSGAGPATQTVMRPTAPATQGGHDLFNPATLANVVPTAAPNYPQDGTPATATVSQNNRTALLLVGNMSPPAGQEIPANAAVSSAVVKVGHGETSGWNFATNGSNRPSLVWGGCTVPLSPNVAKSSPAGTPTLYTSSNLASALDACASFDPSQPATVSWRLNTTNGSAQTATVDGAQVEVTWNDPGVSAQGGCLTQLLNQGGCYVMTGPNNGHNSLNIQGVVYLPDNAMQGTFKNGGSFTVRDALIARSINLDVNPAAVGVPVIGQQNNVLTDGDLVLKTNIGAHRWIESHITYPQGGTASPVVSSWVVEPTN